LKYIHGIEFGVYRVNKKKVSIDKI